MDLSSFQIQLNDAVLSENGNLLATLLHPASQHGKELVKTYRNHTACPPVPPHCALCLMKDLGGDSEQTQEWTATALGRNLCTICARMLECGEAEVRGRV